MISRRQFWHCALAVSLVGLRPWRAAADEAADIYGSAWDLIEAGRFGDAARLLEPKPAAAQSLRTRVLRAGALYFGAEDFSSAQQCFDAALAERAKTDGAEPDTSGAKPNSFLLLRDADIWRHLAAGRQGRTVDLNADEVSLVLSPSTRLLVGRIDIAAYVEEELKHDRVFYDALILNIAEWKGKEDYIEKAIAPLAKGYRCVGNFALAQQALARGQQAEARALFAAALATNAVDLLEFHIAKAELARLG